MTSRVARVSGLLVLAERSKLRQLVGGDLVDRAVSQQPRDVSDEYENIGPLTRVRTSTVETIYIAVAKEAGLDVMRMHRKLVIASVGGALRGIWRVLLRSTSDEALVKRVPLFFGRGLTYGELGGVLLGPGSARVTLSGWPGVSDLQVNGIQAAIEAVLTSAGRTQVAMDGVRTSGGYEWQIRWTSKP